MNWSPQKNSMVLGKGQITNKKDIISQIAQKQKKWVKIQKKYGGRNSCDKFKLISHMSE